MAALSGTINVNDILSLTEMEETAGVRFKQQVWGYCRENLVKLVVYLPSPYVTKFVVDEVNFGIFSKKNNNILLQEITLSTFTSNIGGLLGLCMGLSFVSLVEVLFYLLKFLLNFKYLRCRL